MKIGEMTECNRLHPKKYAVIQENVALKKPRKFSSFIWFICGKPSFVEMEPTGASPKRLKMYSDARMDTIHDTENVVLFYITIPNNEYERAVLW